MISSSHYTLWNHTLWNVYYYTRFPTSSNKWTKVLEGWKQLHIFFIISLSMLLFNSQDLIYFRKRWHTSEPLHLDTGERKTIFTLCMHHCMANISACLRNFAHCFYDNESKSFELRLVTCVESGISDWETGQIHIYFCPRTWSDQSWVRLVALHSTGCVRTGVPNCISRYQGWLGQQIGYTLSQQV